MRIYNLRNYTNPQHIVIEDGTSKTEDLDAFFQLIDSCVTMRIKMENLEYLPDSILRIKHLQKLWLNTPALKQIPEGLAANGLEELHIEQSRIGCLPTDLLGGKKLQKLHVNSVGAGMTKIVGAAPKNSVLQELSLVGDAFDRLPDLRALPLNSLRISAGEKMDLEGKLCEVGRLSSLTLEVPLEAPIRLEELPLFGTFVLTGFQGTRLLEKDTFPQSLRNLQINNAPNLRVLPDFPEKSLLWNVSISKSPCALPDSIGNCENLGVLNLFEWNQHRIPNTLSNCSKLREIDIRQSDITELPASLLRIPSLWHLRVSESKISKLPTDWSKMSSLETLNLSNNKFVINDLSFSKTFVKVKEFIITGNPISDKEIFLFPKRLPLAGTAQIPSVKLGRDTFLPLAAALGKSPLRDSEKSYFFNMICELSHLKYLPDLSLEWMVKGLSVNHASFRKSLRKQLEDHIKKQVNPQPLAKGVVLHISGSSIMRKTELRDKLKDLDITYAPKFSEEVTHLLIGSGPQYEKGWEREGITLVTEYELQDYFSKNQPQFLEEESDGQMADNVLLLLRDKDANNVALGLEMLKNGGAPSATHEDLLVVCKTHPDAAVRKDARDLLSRFGDGDWKLLVDNNLLFKSLYTKMKEQDINNKLQKISQSTGADLACLLAVALFKRFRQGLRYIVSRPHDEEWKNKAYRLLFEDGHFDYSRGLGYTDWRNTHPSQRQMWTATGGVKTPIDIDRLLSFGEKVESLCMHNCKLISIPSKLTALKDLRKLDMSCNFVKKIPVRINKFEKLEELDLSMNRFEEFPTGIIKLPHLKKLDLRHNMGKWSTQPLSVPQEVRDRMPQCEILV